MADITSRVNFSIARGFVPEVDTDEQDQWGWLRIGNPYSTEGYTNVSIEVESAEVLPPELVEDRFWDFPNEGYRQVEAPVQFTGRVLLSEGRRVGAAGVHFRSGLRQGFIALTSMQTE